MQFSRREISRRRSAPKDLFTRKCGKELVFYLLYYIARFFTLGLHQPRMDALLAIEETKAGSQTEKAYFLAVDCVSQLTSTHS